MTVKQLKKIIHDGEGIQVEFKTSSYQLSRDTFESICAFLNRSGGHLLLGVTNNSEVEGVFEDSVKGIIDSLVTSCNDPQKLSPTFYLSPEVIDVGNKKIIYVYVPESSQVHVTAGKIFDRNSDGDFDITKNQALVTQLYIRKQTTFSENRIYPHLSLDDFIPALIEKVRILAKNQNPNNPWNAMDDTELLHSSSLWKKDYQSGSEGFTLAAVVLLGKDEAIQSILPQYKTDAILRVDNLDRYDDRDDIRCNLIDAYGKLNEFIKKHLPDKFYLEGNQRINVRDKIFREVIGNILIHREFSNAFPAKLIIEHNRVYTENWNKPHGNGRIDPSNFSPFPKNPNIARFFKEIGWVDELGSGIRNTSKYCNIYNDGKGEAEFIEGDVFKIIIPISVKKQKVKIPVEEFKTISDIIGLTGITGSLDDVVKDAVTNIVNISVSDAINGAVRGGVSGGVNGGVTGGVSDTVKERLKEELVFIIFNRGIILVEIIKKFRLAKRTAERDIKLLRDLGFVTFEGAPRTGRYIVTEKTKQIRTKRP